MTHSRRVELKEMLEDRLRTIEAQVRSKIRGFRESEAVDAAGPQPAAMDDPVPEDIDFALVQMQAETMEKLNAALTRLAEGQYGICDECEEEIPGKRLRAVPFTTRCLTCQERVEEVATRARRSSPVFSALA
jgi:DnaK suppressor protein